MKISRQHCVDTGLAMVLILLFFKQLYPAMAVVLIAMIMPMLLWPVAKLWFGLSFVLGMIVPRILLSLIFLVILCPIGLLLRVFKPNMMNMKSFKKGSESLFIDKNKMYNASDLANQF